MATKNVQKLEDKHIGLLMDSVNVTAEIMCDKCDKEDSIVNYDNYDAAEEFYNQGWYSTGTITYCPECNATRLKNLAKRRKK